MNLIIDIGNTRTKIGVFAQHKLIEKVIWKEWKLADLEQFCAEKNVEKAILSASGAYQEELIAFLKENMDFFIFLSAETLIPIQNAYKTPQTLGKDRLAAVIAAFYLKPNKNCLVIDTGTCTTFNFLTKEGIFLGGNILPSISLRLKAMHHFTARLPLLEREMQPKLIGDDTESAMQSGAVNGAVVEMKGFIKMYKEQFGALNVLLTGGDADLYKNHLKKLVQVEPNLVLIGLNKILEYNVSKH